MCDVPVAATSWTGYAARRYDFDFSACGTGLRGYRWAFPCVVDAVPHVNVGVYALPPVDGMRLPRELAVELGQLGAAPPPGTHFRFTPTWDGHASRCPTRCWSRCRRGSIR